MKKFLLAPSILSANFACLGEDVSKVISDGADMIHFDVMDNYYVPNLTIGPMVLKSLRNYGIKAPIDVHLMTYNIDNLIPLFAKAGATYITFHPETSDHIENSIKLIKKYGCKAGLVLNIKTPLSYLKYTIDQLDIILIMSVKPGFGGQLFIPSALDKIRKVRNMISNFGLNILLGVDGGIKVENIAESAIAGANLFISGSTIFKHFNYKNIINKMRYELNKLNW